MQIIISEKTHLILKLSGYAIQVKSFHLYPLHSINFFFRNIWIRIELYPNTETENTKYGFQYENHSQKYSKDWIPN